MIIFYWPTLTIAQVLAWFFKFLIHMFMILAHFFQIKKTFKLGSKSNVVHAHYTTIQDWRNDYS
jgi:hypothetical protein